MNLKILPRAIEKMILDNVLEHYYFEVHKTRYTKNLIRILGMTPWVSHFYGNEIKYTKIHYMKAIRINGYISIADCLRSYDNRYSCYNERGDLIIMRTENLG